MVKAMIDRCQCLWARKYVLKIRTSQPGAETERFLISVGANTHERYVRTDIANCENLVSCAGD